jgi:uncharacterized membrane protein YedE/YeeE
MSSRPVAEKLVALGTGVVFGVGLALAQMSDPRKVLGFLDIAGPWDPSLALVLGGALGLSLVTFHFILRRPRPVLAEGFDLPVSRRWLEPRLLIGSTLFGIGWGISGYCPGPAVAQLAAPNAETWVFLPALIIGSLIAKAVNRARCQRAERPT